MAAGCRPPSGLERSSRMNKLTMAAVDAVEIKLTIRPDQELRRRAGMEVDEDTAEVRLIYFYDTPDLDLFEAGVVLRARLVRGDADDSTVKFRPVEAASIAERLAERLKGFKLEADWVGDDRSAPRRLRYRSSATRSTRSRREAGHRQVVLQGPGALPQRASTKGRSISANCASWARFECCAGSQSHETFPLRADARGMEASGRRGAGRGLDQRRPTKRARPKRSSTRICASSGLDPEGAQETKTRTALEYFART